MWCGCGGEVLVCSFKRDLLECLVRLQVQESTVFVHGETETPAASWSKNLKATEWGCSVIYPSLLLRA